MKRHQIIAQMAALLLDAKANIDHAENFGKIMEAIARLAGARQQPAEEIIIKVIELPLPDCGDPHCPVHGHSMCN